MFRELYDCIASLKKRSQPDLGQIITKTGAELLTITPALTKIAGELVAVDGSVNAIGNTFPYIIYWFRSQAHSTQQGKLAEVNRFFSPYIQRDKTRLEVISEKGLEPEEAILRIRWAILSEIELQAAIEALDALPNESLVLFDGSFARLYRHKKLWQQYLEVSLAKNIISVGISEEINTSRLIQFMPGALTDREVLFGLLEPGQCLVMPEYQNVITVYARPSAEPQPISYSFLANQKDFITTILSNLFALTPASGRGFPLWLDIVDQKVRITQEEVEMLLNTLGQDVIMRWFTPMRKKRPL